MAPLTRMRYRFALGLSALLTALQAGFAATVDSSPPWTRDLVIYEIATKAFTSPNGPESGTFESLKARLPYLQDLGITGIWLTGHSLSDPKHFLNIWTQYACIEPDRIDPSLGTPEEFKALIDDAHSKGIKIFLDVITHGVMKQSSLLEQHPEWFRGEFWGGMVEYDWSGGHTDLDDWWVHLWTDYVTRYGVDGFRLDLGTNRPDLWARIRRNAIAAGHPIVIFEESSYTLPGVMDFGQYDNFLSNGMLRNEVLLTDVPRLYRGKFGKEGDYSVKVIYQDGKEVEDAVGKGGPLDIRLDGLKTDRVSERIHSGGWGLGGYAPDGLADLQLSVKISAEQRMKGLLVLDQRSGRRWAADVDWWVPENAPWIHAGPIALSGQAPSIQIHLPILTYGNSITLSSHDNGQVGFPLDGRSPYSAQGSRAMFGYSFLFTPMIPMFMSGEEFDATFHALPGLSPDFFGGRNTGKGRWLYGSMLDWNELEQPRHRNMWVDVKRMLALRRQEAVLLSPQLRGDIEPQLVAVQHQSDVTVPVPYMRWSGNAGIVVVANPNIDADAHLKLNIPLAQLGGDANAKYQVTDLWNATRPKTYSAKALTEFSYTVKRDKTPRGGIGLLKVEWMR